MLVSLLTLTVLWPGQHSPLTAAMRAKVGFKGRGEEFLSHPFDVLRAFSSQSPLVPDVHFPHPFITAPRDVDVAVRAASPSLRTRTARPIVQSRELQCPETAETDEMYDKFAAEVVLMACILLHVCRLKEMG